MYYRRNRSRQNGLFEGFRARLPVRYGSNSVSQSAHIDLAIIGLRHFETMAGFASILLGNDSARFVMGFAIGGDAGVASFQFIVAA